MEQHHGLLPWHATVSFSLSGPSGRFASIGYLLLGTILVLVSILGLDALGCLVQN